MAGSRARKMRFHIVHVHFRFLPKKRSVLSSINGDDGTPGFGVYLHWPFCAAKCPYCDFNSHVRRKPIDQRLYVDGFLSELEQMRSETGPRPVTSVFLGGGTPSLMEPQTVEALLNAVDDYWGLPNDAEITIEANPSSVDASRFRGYAAAGVNRVSLGVQALNDVDLKYLGRLHDTKEAKDAIELAREIFPRLSFDLIYARPGQTVQTWQTELHEALGYAADHLSLYQLTIEDNTPFKALHNSGKLVLPTDDLAADLYEITDQVTSAAGLINYEVSNYAVPGAESRHNLTYWRYGDYVGAGPGAHGRFARDDGMKMVTIAEPMPEKWLDLTVSTGHGIVEREILDKAKQGDEMLLMSLRLSEGLDVARYETLAGKCLNPSVVQNLYSDGLLETVSNSRLRVTPAGRMVLNSLVSELAG